MESNYNYVKKLVCPICKELFEPIEGRITPFFYYFDDNNYCKVDMCFSCADKVMKTIQAINPEITVLTYG